MRKVILVCMILLTSCASVVRKLDEKIQENRPNSKSMQILFSHNISGETHPCGCRQFPLGGLPQIYGLMQSISKEHEVLYVDTGDTFFPSSNIPTSMHSSLSFAANNLAKALDQLGLKYFVPGDQDFALGIEFLKEMANQRHFQFLISNLKDESTIKHQNYALIEKDNAKIFLLGFVNPESINTKESELFSDVNSAFNTSIELLKQKGFDPNNKYHRLVVLSHAGIDLDEKLAEKFPRIDWIIGSHSQSFLRFSRDVGNTKIVQTLSKNHYLGDISIDLERKSDRDSYQLHEIRDELEKLASPNPMRDFINEHKTKMNELQIQEQSKMGINPIEFPKSPKKITTRIPTANTCLECHKDQTHFWQSTPHSLAYATLMNSKEQNNLQCVKCHSVGLNDPRGFNNAKNIVSFKNKPIIDYWPKAHAITENIKSVRKLKSTEITKHAKEWMQLDQKMGIKHNYANVQCLNCHQLSVDHPFSESIKISKNEIKARCLTCHTSDQSPEWYHKNDLGLPSRLNDLVFEEQYKKMSCPSVQ